MLQLLQGYSYFTNKQNIKNKSSPTTQAIPFPPSHVPRTKSEIKLHEDIAVFEWHDICMFNLLVNGMKRIQAKRLEHLHRSSSSSTNDSFVSDAYSDLNIEQYIISIARHHYEDIQEVSPRATSTLKSSEGVGAQDVAKLGKHDVFQMIL